MLKFAGRKHTIAYFFKSYNHIINFIYLMNKFLLSLGAVALSATTFASEYRIVGDQLTADQMLALPANSKVVVRTHARGQFGWWKAITTNSETGEGYFIHRDTELAQDNTVFPEDFVYTVTVNADNSFTFKNAFDRYLPKAETQTNNVVFSSNVTDPAEAESLTIITNPAIQESSSCAGMYVFRASTTCSGQSHSDLHLEINGDYCYPKFYATANGGLQQPADAASKTVAASALYLVEEIVDNTTPAFSGAGLVSRESYATDIVDGAVIALQCKDTNGGLNYFFNGPAVKSATLGYEQLYQVIGKDNGFILKRLSDNTYVGKNGNSQTSVENEADAAVFTAAPANLTGWTTKPVAVDPNTAPTIRFTTGGTFLNCQAKASTPAYAGGTGGYSGWFVYTFNPQQVEKLRAAADNSYTTGNFFEGIAGKKVVISNEAATELTPGWYILHNVGRNGYAKQENAKLFMRNLPNETRSGNVEEFAPFMFYVEPNPYPYYDDNNKYAIRSVYGDYFHYIQGGVNLTAYAPEIQSALISGSDNNFYLRDVATGKILDGNPTGDESGNTVVGYGDNIPTTDGGNNSYQFFAVTVADEFPVSVTVKMFHDGHLIATETVTGFAGNEIHVTAPDFFNDNITVTIPEQQDQTINFDLQQLSIPFKYTETTENLIWQAIRIKPGIGKECAWAYNVDPANPNKLVANLLDNDEIGFTDEQLWAIVGNMADGFKIYNRAAGLDKCLYKSDANAVVGESDENNVWTPKLTKGNYASTADYCAFFLGEYINLQEADSELKFWWENDQGSTLFFVAPAQPLLDAASDFVIINSEYNGPANAVGAVFTNGVDISEGTAIIAAAENDKYDLEAAEALRNFIALYNGNVTVNRLQPNGFYRLQSINFADQYLYTSSDDDNIYSAPLDAHRLNYHTIFCFEPVAGQADRYYLQSQGLYVGQTHQNHAPMQVNADGARGEYSLVTINHDDDPNIPTSAAFAICDNTQSDYNFFHQGQDAANEPKQITAWRQWAHGSHFYVLKAEHIEVALDHQHDKMNVGFGYFPFAVSATDDETKFYFINESTNKETGEAIITYTETASVPANTAFMISHDNDTSAILAIGNEGAANARRRAIAAEGNNDINDGFADTDNWTGDSWTKVGADNVPAQITALGVNADNVRMMQRTMTFTTAGDLTADFLYTNGNDRLDICGLALCDAEGNIVNGDFHTGFSGVNKVDKVFSVKIPAAGTYTVRYYSSNADNALNTNGDINVTFVAKDNTNILHGHLRQNQAQAGDYVLQQTANGLSFVKVTEPTDVAGNFAYIPAANLYDKSLTEAAELPLENRDGTTGICDVNVEQPAAAKVIYDLQGRRLSAPVKGLNIVNGVKVLVK